MDTLGYLKGREPEWSNPQIEDGKLPEMPKNQVKLMHSIMSCKFFKNVNHQQLLKYIVRVFPNWYVGMYLSWVRPLALRPSFSSFISHYSMYPIILYSTQTHSNCYYHF